MSTIKDVAKLSGVSISTVSLVLNGSNAVKHETRYKVKRAIDTLQYRPNLNARSLVTRKKKVIGVVRCTSMADAKAYAFDSIVDTFLAEMMKSIEVQINRTGYSLLLDWSETSQDIEVLPPLFDPNKVDGILMVGAILNDRLLERVIATGIPVVLVGARHPALDFVDTDPEQGIYLAVKHLIGLGHTEIAFLNGPDISQTSPRKLDGFEKALREAGLPVRKDHIGKGTFSGKAGYDAMASFWTAGIRPTAIVAAVDCMALGAMRFLHEQGVQCPRDISVIGFEDGILAEYSIPPLTTIRVHKEELGAEACRVLLHRLENPNAQRVKLRIEPKLVIRDSVRPGFKTF
jgi:DNA-binding LacI/PurR family transcriptional regulator